MATCVAGGSAPVDGLGAWSTGRRRVDLIEANARRPTALRSVSHAAFHSKRAPDASDSRCRRNMEGA
jgi:hypothetical protein